MLIMFTYEKKITSRMLVLFLLRRRDVELEMDDIAILNDVRFTFLSVFPGGFHFRHRIRR